MSDAEIRASIKKLATVKDGVYSFYLTPIREELGIESYAEVRRWVMGLGAEPKGLGEYTIPIETIEDAASNNDVTTVPDNSPEPADSHENDFHNCPTSDFTEPPKIGIPQNTGTVDVPPEIVLEPNKDGVYEAVETQRQLAINADAIPAELKTRRQWVMWRWATREGENKPTKPPYQIRSRCLNRGAAKPDAPSTWTTFEEVYAQPISDTPNFGIKPNDGRDPGPECGKRFSGIGYVFSKDDPYTGIDLDNCLNPDGTLKPWAKPIIDKLRPVAYLEISPSGTGIKAWTRAKLPPDSRHNTPVTDGKLEVYDQARYFTVTAHNGSGAIRDGQAVIDWIYETYFPKPETKKPKPATVSPARAAKPFSGDVSELIRQIRNSKQSTKFDKLFNGNWADYRVGTEGASRADEALCCIIAFWTQDAAQIDAVFRQSGLMRPKWDEKHKGDGATYGQMTIEFALANLREAKQTARMPMLPRPERRKRRKHGWLL